MFHLRRPRFATVFATELRLSQQQLQQDPPGGGGEPHTSPGKGTYRSPHTEIFTRMVPLLCSDPRKKNTIQRIGRAMDPMFEATSESADAGWPL